MQSPTLPDAIIPEALWSRAQGFLLDGLFNVAAAAIILVVGFWIAAALSRGVRRITERSKRLDTTLAAFLASLVRYGVYAVVLVAVLQRFGVQTTSIVAVLGAATLAIGLALQGTLSNVAAGVMLVMFRPYRLGEFVEIGDRRGVVKDITLFTTELATIDNVKVVLPNSLCWGAPIANFSHHATRMVELTFLVGFSAPLDRALETIREAVTADPRVHADPAPFVAVDSLRDFAVVILVRAWCANSDWVGLRYSLVQTVKAALDRAGVEIPYPTSVALQVVREASDIEP